MNRKILFLATAVLFFLTNAYSQTSSSNDVNKKEAEEWFNKKEWMTGLRLAPDQSVNVQEFYKQYMTNNALWNKAFTFLKEHDLKNLSTGRHEIDGDNVYALVSEGASKDFDSTQWESHRKYIDLQYVIKGTELIGVHPVAKSTITKPYDDHKDIIHYSADGELRTATPEVFFIFFPSDAHRPNITPGGNQKVKKLVIKISFSTSCIGINHVPLVSSSGVKTSFRSSTVLREKIDLV